MVWQRVRSLFTKETGVPTAKHPAVVPETVPRRRNGAIRERFRVERAIDGVTYQAYAGENGTDARKAWEAYQASDKLGVFTFYDGDAIRGAYNR